MKRQSAEPSVPAVRAPLAADPRSALRPHGRTPRLFGGSLLRGSLLGSLPLALAALVGSCGESDSAPRAAESSTDPLAGELELATSAANAPSSAPAPTPATGVAPPSTSPDARRAPAANAPPAAPQLPRPTDPLYLSVARAIETGDAAAARRDWLRLAPGLHTSLLNARLYALEGDGVAAVREIESSRAAHPDQGAVFATAAEIHAAGGRLSSAEDEVREGLIAAGETPELLRARGVLALSREGGALTGLGHLLEARRRAPELEFTTHMLAEAYRLLGAAALGERKPAEATAFARSALELQPDDVDTRQMLGDSLAAQGDFEGAIEQYEGVLAGGADVRAACALMNVRGATAALLESKREVAVARYVRARELGSSDEELGFGANVLDEELAKALAAGLDAYDRGTLDAARASFQAALRLQPASLEARNHLAVVHFKQGEFEGAAARWREVLELARRTGVELPEPTHLNLARALFQLGKRDEVRTLLVEWLERHPSSEHAEATRAMLARLDGR
jgi:tetratricopeptide (TPR) repeat protein